MRYRYLAGASLIVGIGRDHDGHDPDSSKQELDAHIDAALANQAGQT